MRKTIDQVAQLAKVSKATVSRVMNNSPKVTEETREKVMKVIKESGYYPSATARRLTTNKAETIGIIIPAPHDRTFGNPFYTEIIRGFAHQAKIKKYDLLLFTNEHKFNYSQLFYDRRVDGLLLIGVKRNDKGIIQLIKKEFPYILTGKIDYEDANYIDAENVIYGKENFDYDEEEDEKIYYTDFSSQEEINEEEIKILKSFNSIVSYGYLDKIKTINWSDFYPIHFSKHDITRNNMGSRCDRMFKVLRAIKKSEFFVRDFIVLAGKVFSDNELWEDGFGGPAWASIASGWLKLYNAEKMNEIIEAVDHVYDLEHNNDIVFDKMGKYYSRQKNSFGEEVAFKWIKKNLNRKARAISPYELISYVSPVVRIITQRVLFYNNKTTLEGYKKKIKEYKTRIKTLNKLERKKCRMSLLKEFAVR